jgi:hypothetical protein
MFSQGQLNIAASFQDKYCDECYELAVSSEVKNDMNKLHNEFLIKERELCKKFLEVHNDNRKLIKYN